MNEVLTWFKENGWWISLLLIFIALAMLIFLLIQLPADAQFCMKEPIQYYTHKTGVECFCGSIVNGF